MKQLILFSLIFIHITGKCQLKVYNESITNKDSAVVYIGITNYLKIDGQQDLSKLKVTSTNSEIAIVDNYISLQPFSRGVDTIRVYSDKKLLSSTTFRIERINNPVAQLAFTLDSVISLNRILANPYLTVKIPNCLYEIKYNISSFQCSLQKAGRSNFNYMDFVNGNKLTDDILKLIQKFLPGDKIVFDEIKVACGSGDTRKLPRLIITIK